ncbi:MAG: hypothetical protein IIU07_00965, partial [Lachnospiraceae bacterium]|nr:hypothetical protein [Lachnospiraceae bacterium]
DEDISDRVNHIATPRRKRPDDMTMHQLSLFDMNHDDDIITELKELEIDAMTPIDAMNTLYRLHDKAMKENGEDKEA